MGALRNLRDEATGVLALLILGAGLLALFFPGLSPVPFWVVFIVGYAVVLPLFAILFDQEAEVSIAADRAAERDDGEESALETLKRRYATGELSEAEFERRLERLLETEDEASAAEYLARRERETERERD